jgi:hypothetical protein
MGDTKEWMQYGWPTLALLAIGYAAWKIVPKIWDVYKENQSYYRQLHAEARDYNRSLTKEFMAAQERRDEMLRLRDAEFIKRLDLIVVKLDRRKTGE